MPFQVVGLVYRFFEQKLNLNHDTLDLVKAYILIVAYKPFSILLLGEEVIVIDLLLPDLGSLNFKPSPLTS
jgi:hypothetical protein